MYVTKVRWIKIMAHKLGDTMSSILESAIGDLDSVQTRRAEQGEISTDVV